MVARTLVFLVLVTSCVPFGTSINGEEPDRFEEIVYPKPILSSHRPWFKEFVEQKPYAIQFAVGHSDNWDLPLGTAKDNGDLASLPFRKLLSYSEMLTVRAAAGESGLVTTKSGVNIFYRLSEVDEVPQLELVVEDRDEPRVENGIPSITTRHVNTRLEPTLSEWFVVACLGSKVVIQETQQPIQTSWNVAVRVERHVAGEP